ncbi:hypothetical protein LL045_08090 [Lactococcus lactis subsp. lactis]|uniref:hypothetical protein n=1 Tax=Lactococcus lactis TaxID=1358 RepID=UPI0037487C74
MSELDEIFPAARIKVFTGEYKLYTDMSEFDKEIEEVDVYSKEQVLKLLEPQLTIPKSVADEIDCVVNPIGQIVLKSGILSDFTVEAISWIYKNNENGYIAIAYANPLTRDLVKVVEG